MKQSLKDIVSLIKKQAQDAGAPPNDLDGSTIFGPPPPPVDPDAPPSPEVAMSPAKNIVRRFSSIKEMQMAMQSFVRAVSKDAQLEDYINNQYLKNIEGRLGENKDRSMLSELKSIETKEFPIDGKWGPKTSNGINNIADFANSLVQMAGHFNLRIEGPYMKNAQDFFDMRVDLATGNVDKKEDIGERAKKVSAYIKSLITLFNLIRDKIKDDQGLDETIRGEAAIDIHSPTPTNIEDLDDGEKVLLSHGSNVNIDLNLAMSKDYRDLSKGGNAYEIKPIKNIPLSSLQTKEDFLSWVKSQGLRIDMAPEILNDILAKLQAITTPTKP